MNILNESQISERIKAVEQGLRFRVLIKGRIIEKMTIFERMHYYKVPGVSIAVINNGIVEWSKVYGKLDVLSKRPVELETLFQAGSISKLITAIGALKLVQGGKLSLDANVNDFLTSWKVPENEFAKVEKVTLRRLLSHSAGTSVSGFPGYSVKQKIPTILQVLDGIKPSVNTDAVRVMQIPGTNFQYSGGGTEIIQLLMENVTNEPFEQWMKKNIFSPLGMNSSTFEQPLPLNFVNIAAHGHLSNGDKVLGNWNIYPEMAAAGLWSTPSDLARAAIAIHSIYGGNIQGILSPDLVKEMLSTQMDISERLSSGLGVFLKNKNNNFIFEHGGLNHGFSAYFSMHSLSGQGVIVMTNADYNGFPFMRELMCSISDVYHWPNSELYQREEISFDLNNYKWITGKYYLSNDPKEVVEVYSSDNKLYFKSLDVPAEQLYLEAKDQFFTKENETIYFKQIEKHNQMQIQTEDGETILFFKEDTKDTKKINKI